MIRSLLKSVISSFERRYNYDAGYMHEINDVSVSATIRLLSFTGITNYRGKETAIWGGAGLAATLHGDCGPCAQLLVDRLIELEIAPEQIQSCLEKDFLSAGALGLGFQFAQAVLNGSDGIDDLANRIRIEYGKESLIAAAYAASTYTTYPLLKRALGYSKACQLIDLGNNSQIKVNSAA